MVLIIRNNRILSSRHPRIKKILSYVQKNQQKSNQKETSNDQNREQRSIMSLTAVLGKLFLYNVAMFTLPFVAFFGVQRIINTEFNVDRFTTNCISVFAAVATVNMIIAYYVYHVLYAPDDAPEVKAVANLPSKDSLNKKVE